jgi:predicted O-linked N-acetylglucosamine transferase (SPINDLY family)
VTFKGRSFASRVSESLLNAIGLPDLVAEDPAGFADLAVALAGDPERLAEIRARLAANRVSAPLFDTERFTRHLERAYEMMIERARAGLAPDHIDVPALPPREGAFLV